MRAEQLAAIGHNDFDLIHHHNLNGRCARIDLTISSADEQYVNGSNLELYSLQYNHRSDASFIVGTETNSKARRAWSTPD